MVIIVVTSPPIEEPAGMFIRRVFITSRGEPKQVATPLQHFHTQGKHADKRNQTLHNRIPCVAIHQGVELVDLDSSSCVELLGGFIEEHPEIWNEDIGV